MFFIATFIILLILPGYGLVSLLAPKLPWFQRLPAGFAASLTLLGLPAVLLLNLHAPLTTLAWLALPITIIPTTLHLHRQFTNKPITQLPITNYQSTQLPNYPITNYQLPILILLTIFALYLFLSTAAIRNFGDHWFYLTFIRHYLDLPLDPALNPLAGFDATTGTLNRAATNGWWVVIALLVKVSGQPLLESYWLVLPPLLMVVSLIAFYGLAWELFENHKAAQTAVLLQLLLYFTTISSHDWIGQGFFTRIAEDKYLVWLVLLPIALFLLLRYLKTGHWQTLVLLALSVAAIAITHQFGLLQFAFAAACFALVYLPLNRRKVSRLQTAVLLAPLALFLIIPIVQRLLPNTLTLTQFIPSEIQTPPNDTHLMLLSAETQRYLLHPHPIFHPLILLAILLSPLLLRYIKQSTPAQFLFAATIPPLLLLYNPITAPILGRFLSPLLLWRITWILPTTLLLTFITHKIIPHLTSPKTINHQSTNKSTQLPITNQPINPINQSTNYPINPINQSTNYPITQLPITNPQSPIPKLTSILTLLALTYLLIPYVTDGIDLLQDYKTRIVTQDQQSLLNYLCENKDLTGVIIADPLLNTLIPACASQAGLLTYRIFQSQPTAAEEIERFYNGRLLTQSSITFLNDWQARYIILPNQAPIAAQISRLPELFTETYANTSYSLYEFQPADHPIVAANEAYIRADLLQAESLYAQARENPALAAYGLGLLSQAVGDNDAAESHFRSALNHDPTFPSPYLALAAIYRQNGRPNQAQSLLTEALTHIPDNRLIHQTLGDIFLELGDETAAIEQYQQSIPPATNGTDTHLARARLYMEKGLTQAAFTAYQEVFKAEIGLRRLSNTAGIWATWGRSLTFDRRADRLADALREMGQYYEGLGQTTSAEIAYVQLIELLPARENSYEPLAGLYRRTGRQSDVITLYSKAVRANFHLSWPYRRLAAAFLAEYRRSQEWTPLLHEAIDKLEMAQAIEPENAENYSLLAEAYDLLGRSDDVETLYRRAAHDYPWLAWPRLNLARFYLEKGDFSAAQSALTTAIDRQPTGQTAYNLLAEAYLNRGETAAAIDLYQQAVAANENRAWPYLGRANAYLAAGMRELALASLAEGLSREPDNPAVYSTLGNIYRWNVGDPETAVTHFNQSLALDPNQPDVYMALASTYITLGQGDDALNHLEIALSLSSQSAPNYQTAGDIYWQLGRVDQAQQYYRQALNIDPHNPAAHLGMAQTFRQQGALEQALEHAQQAARFSSSPHITAPAQMIQAQIYLATLRPDEALPLIQAALEALPSDPWYNATAGDYYHYHQNNPAQAIPYYRKAAELAPQQAILQAALGTALYDAGQTAEAIPIMEQAIALAPTDPAVYLRIGSVLNKYADWEQLIQFYETAVANNITHPDIQTQLTNAYSLLEQ